MMRHLFRTPRLRRSAAPMADLLDHPDLARMTPRELADLPLPRDRPPPVLPGQG